MQRISHQKGTLIRVPLKSGDIWRFRFRDGDTHRSEYVGTLKQYPTKARAEKAADRFRRRLNTNLETITVSDLIAKFWREAALERETTAASYRSIFTRIEEQWGKERIDSLAGKTAEIKDWLDRLETVRGDVRRVSPLYRGQVRNLLHSLFEKAMLWNHTSLERNPMDVVRLKGTTQRQKAILALTPDQYQRLLEDPELPLLVKTVIAVLGGTGLRISECLGLRWDDIDLDAGKVFIRRSVVGGRKYATKTSGSTRKLPLDEAVVSALRRWRVAEPAVKGWVFGSERTGLPYDRDYLRAAYLQPAGVRVGIEGLGWHQFRHSYRAMMREAGVSLESQKSLMRHSKLSTTVDTYGGDDDVERLRAANSKVVSILLGRTA